MGVSYSSSNPQSVFCRTWGSEVKDSSGNYNHWWLWTELDSPLHAPAWISAYYIKDQGNDQANDIKTGKPIPDCPSSSPPAQADRATGGATGMRRSEPAGGEDALRVAVVAWR